MPHNIALQRFENWSDFKASFADYLPGRDRSDHIIGRYIYRGQASANWQLASAFDRYCIERDVPDAQIQYETWMRWYAAELKASHSESYPHGSFELIALAQHHGLPTRLMDWSWSPYVAAFFAFEEAFWNSSLKEMEPTIWAINLERLRSISSSDEVEILTPVDRANKRMRNQNGLFLQMKSGVATLDDFIERKSSATNEVAVQFVLPPTERRIAIEDLNLMGIDHRLIQPELGGIAKFVMMRSQLEVG